MWEFIYKVLMLFCERKDKYKHAEEKAIRRDKFFNDIKSIDNSEFNDYEKRARKNVISQELVGNQLVSFELIDFLIKNKNIINFEIVAKTIALWETSLVISINDKNEITKIIIQKKEYRKEKIMMFISLFFIAFILICSIHFFKLNVIWLTKALMLPEYIAIAFFAFITVMLAILFIFLLISSLILSDLNRIIERINK